MMKSSRSPPPLAPGEGSGKTAAKKWVGWEEEVVLDDIGQSEVRYYLCCAPPRDGDGEVERDLAVVGKLSDAGNVVYWAHDEFVWSIHAAAARSPGPSRALTVTVEATQLGCKSRREVMDWLTSLVAADSPYITSASASKDDPSASAGNNPEGFTWLGHVPHLDKWWKHYRSFCRYGMRISVHDFIYIKSEEGTESKVGYVEGLYEYGSANCMVLARWLDKPGDNHGFEMHPDVHKREVFFSNVLQDIGVNWVEGLAPVLNYQHFEWFKRREEDHKKWKPYLCHRQIVGTTLKPFNIAQLQGYTNQEIVQGLFRAPSSMAVQSKKPKEKTDGGQKRKHTELSEDQLMKNPASLGNVTNDRAIEIHTALVATDTVQKLPQRNAVLESIHVDEISSKLLPQNIVSQQSIHKGKGVLTVPATPRPTLQSREKDEDGPAKPSPQKTMLLCSSQELGLQFGKKGPADEPAKPVAEKVSRQYYVGDGMSSVNVVPPDNKRPGVDHTNFLKPENVLKWAKRKARGSGPLMGYSDANSQEGVAICAPNGDTATVNSEPVKEKCKINELAHVVEDFYMRCISPLKKRDDPALVHAFGKDPFKDHTACGILPHRPTGFPMSVCHFPKESRMDAAVSDGMWKTLEAEEVPAPPQVQDQPAQPPKQNLVKSPSAQDPVAKSKGKRRLVVSSSDEEAVEASPSTKKPRSTRAVVPPRVETPVAHVSSSTIPFEGASVLSPVGLHKGKDHIKTTSVGMKGASSFVKAVEEEVAATKGLCLDLAAANKKIVSLQAELQKERSNRRHTH
ncbi:hypothetical protein ACQ4PT_071307 [Festuca glaucescens]